MKMRAWDELNKVMHNNFNFIESGEEGNDWIIFTSDKRPLDKKETNPFNNPSPFFSQQLKKMYGTGMILSTGELFTGDLVEVTAYNEDQEIIGSEKCLIFFERGAFVYAPSEKYRGLTEDGLFDRYKAQYIGYKLLGNKYENPELAKKIENWRDERRGNSCETTK